jgi:hypothetical protein
VEQKQLMHCVFLPVAGEAYERISKYAYSQPALSAGANGFTYLSILPPIYIYIYLEFLWHVKCVIVFFLSELLFITESLSHDPSCARATVGPVVLGLTCRDHHRAEEVMPRAA